jgi:hypothetical protein
VKTRAKVKSPVRMRIKAMRLRQIARVAASLDQTATLMVHLRDHLLRETRATRNRIFRPRVNLAVPIGVPKQARELHLSRRVNANTQGTKPRKDSTELTRPIPTQRKTWKFGERSMRHGKMLLVPVVLDTIQYMESGYLEKTCVLERRHRNLQTR